LPYRAAAGGEGDEMAALEAEFAAAAAADAAAVGALRERAARERARGLALRNQRAVWEAVLEMRILLQRCLQARGQRCASNGSMSVARRVLVCHTAVLQTCASWPARHQSIGS